MCHIEHDCDVHAQKFQGAVVTVVDVSGASCVFVCNMCFVVSVSLNIILFQGVVNVVVDVPGNV